MSRIGWMAVLFVAAAAGAARPDAVAYSCGAPANVQPVTGRDNACIGFVSKDASGKQVSSAKGDFHGGGEFLASADGRSVAFLNSHPMDFGDKTDGLVMYRDGKLVARYSMKDLVVRMTLISESTSHTQWVDRIASATIDKTLDLTTMSMRHYVFDAVTGKETTAEDSARWTKCDVIAYAGDRVSVQGGVGTIDHPGIAKGTVKGKISFDLGKGVQVSDNTSGFTVCLTAKKGGGWLAIDAYNYLFNTLPMP